MILHSVLDAGAKQGMAAAILEEFLVRNRIAFSICASGHVRLYMNGRGQCFVLTANEVKKMNANTIYVDIKTNGISVRHSGWRFARKVETVRYINENDPNDVIVKEIEIAPAHVIYYSWPNADRAGYVAVKTGNAPQCSGI